MRTVLAVAGLFSAYSMLARMSDVDAGGVPADSPAPLPNGAGDGADHEEADPAAVINYDVGHAYTINREFQFHFKKTTNELGEVEKRPTVKLVLPVPTLEGVVAALRDEKQREYILEILAEQVKEAARQQVGDDEKPVNKQDELDVSKLTLQYLANVPKAQRTGGGIGKEVWEQFAADYMAVMPAATGKNADQVGNAVKLLVAKFNPVKTNKKVIKFLREQLAVYAGATENLEDYAECVEFLDNKAETLLSANEEQLLANL
jgi:hypothetical protein